jgi:excisionase family DNA binding protein
MKELNNNGSKPTTAPATQKTIKTPLPRLAYSIREMAELLGISYGSAYRLVRRGLIKTSGALRHKIVPAVEIHRFLTETD